MANDQYSKLCAHGFEMDSDYVTFQNQTQ